MIAAVVSSCRSDNQQLENYALELANANRSEIEAVLTHYSDERAEVASYLVASMIGQYSTIGDGIDSIEQLYRKVPRMMPTGITWALSEDDLDKGKKYMQLNTHRVFDLEHIEASYLINNLDLAWDSYKNHKWNIQLSISDFCELILPYRIGDEKITNWREAYMKEFQTLDDTLSTISSSVMAAHVVAQRLGEVPYNVQLKTPHRSAIDLLEAPLGYCRDDCDRTLYSMRALGIPVAIDFILASPDNGTAHQWVVVRDNIDNKYRMFDNKRFLPTRDSIHNDKRSKGKVYRQIFALNSENMQNSDNDAEPSFLNNPRMKDVTFEYFGHNNAVVELNDNTLSPVYLGLFTTAGFFPIDKAKCLDNKAVFDDIEPNVIYFPIKNIGASYSACGYPFLINKNGEVHIFKPNMNKMHAASLIRKMPLRFIQKERMATLIGTKIQCSNSEAGPWTDVYTFNVAPKTSYHMIKTAKSLNEKYIRILPPKSETPKIAELSVYSDKDLKNKLPLSVVGDDTTKKLMKPVIDEDILSWAACNDTINGSIFHIDSDDIYSAIAISPQNDDNFVVPGQEYELLYFDKNDWISLGRKVATDYSIRFDVPDNAVFLLLNHTKGKEVQVFVYQEGKQKFSIDSPR
jgi:hypothetical protein